MSSSPASIGQAVDLSPSDSSLAKHLTRLNFITQSFKELPQYKADPAQVAQAVKGSLGLWLLAAPRFDAAGRLWDDHGPIAGEARVREFLKFGAADAIFDAVYANQEEEYTDIQQLVAVSAPQGPSSSERHQNGTRR